MRSRTQAAVYPERPQRPRATPGQIALTAAFDSCVRQLYAAGKSDQTTEPGTIAVMGIDLSA